MQVKLPELERKYWKCTDPWLLQTDPLGHEICNAIYSALSKETYRSAVELGCGNGALAGRLRQRCDNYVDINGAAKALLAARQSVSGRGKIRREFPCPLPDGDHDLIILSDILYFLDADEIRELAKQISQSWSGAEIISFTYFPEDPQVVNGGNAFEIFKQALAADFTFKTTKHASGYQIDHHVRADQSLYN
ncbi:MAG: class I SAM-dependent methyltransferase [Sulfitobacter sp.]|jgi:SAM-dependent methyltransferase|uniref:methyltransferase domain-containing protein n=1 Tax=Sulfitobacter sp. TaxID=1903071 RepID=UPI000C4CBE89|nr:methyltransferase [Roseobacter sp.]MBV50330.1 methyltransferase [Roseobacter sp.]|tara:strand:- start:16908 stop:17483 length:576 start_codon:yes stop_codon:yes gene_type:complete